MDPKNLLDLREKISPQIIEKIILQKRSWYGELMRTLLIVLVATGAIWGITKADILLDPNAGQAEQIKNFSALGIVSDITDSSISINSVNHSDDPSKTSFTFSTAFATKIETQDYAPLSLSDIKVGDKVIVQGTSQSDNIEIKRIISFGAYVPLLDATASSTKDTNIASSTATSTDTPTSTKEISGTSTDVTTDASSTSSTTPDTSSSTPDISDATSTATTSSLTDIVTNVISNIVDVITGGSSTPPAPEINPPAPTPPADNTPPAPPVDSTPPADTPPAPTN